jgi:hypothetical protein
MHDKKTKQKQNSQQRMYPSLDRRHLQKRHSSHPPSAVEIKCSPQACSAPPGVLVQQSKEKKYEADVGWKAGVQHLPSMREGWGQLPALQVPNQPHCSILSVGVFHSTNCRSNIFLKTVSVLHKFRVY